METYLVGGAVRDRLLGLEVNERDWVVVGETPAAMRERGFQQVGKDFPVFLHPESHEEYALARTERKAGRGYHGFEFDTDPSVTLTEDLRRRDLTVNAIAEAPDGSLIDPHGGQGDIEARLLRHVSDAFAEDPVRILRVARFATRFAPLGFSVHPATIGLMRDMVNAGEAEHLQRDRVWAETQRAMALPAPSVFFQVLRDCDALAVLFPDIDRLFGVPQPAEWHPEIDTGVHTLMVIDQAARLSPSPAVRFAALTHDLGKGLTPEDQWPSHRGHEERSVDLVKGWCQRYPVPNESRDLAVLVAELHGNIHRAFELKASTILKLLKKTDGMRRAPRFDEFLLACEADSRGRTGFEDRDYSQADYLRRCQQAAAAISMASIDATGLSGPAIGEALDRARLNAIEAVKRETSLD